MRNIPYKALILCFLLPPVCYVLTIQGLNRYFYNKEYGALRKIIVQDYDALYEGRFTVEEEVNKNITNYLKKRFISKLGVSINILVKTKSNKIIYPPEAESFTNSFGPKAAVNYVEVATQNYKTLNQGLDLQVDVRVRHNSWMSNGVLVLYSLIALFFLQKAIKKKINETEARAQDSVRLANSLNEQLREAENRLTRIRTKESEYVEKIDALRKEKNRLAHDIDDLLEEMEKLERGLEKESDSKRHLEAEAESLRKELEKLRARAQKSKGKKKKLEITNKRFRVLYKNLSFTDRAIEGYLDLPEEFQLKAEEVINILNIDDRKVQVRRKVFGKGGKMNILEADFLYSGRIYFQKDSNSKVKILAIGTKNTQNRDLAYLESVN